VQFSPTQFTPSQDLYAGLSCGGVLLRLAPHGDLRSMRMGIEIADALHKMYPDKFQIDKILTLLGSQATLDRIKHGDSPSGIVKGWTPDLDKFRDVRAKYLLYR
jgi:uncharacterized protein YbbC (DUF1343 family)